ncbi:MAG TPA: TIGR03084 family metal-binding protein [Actinocatenispora sp.]
MVEIAALLTDLADEGRELDTLVADLPTVRWAAPTPAPRWTIAHQIAHLAWTDDLAYEAVTDPAGLGARIAGVDVTAWVDAGAAEGASADPAELLARWRTGRVRLASALATVPAGVRLPWVGTRMSAASMATGRLMETWAHGQDVADTLGHTCTPTSRLRHVARIGVRARDHTFVVRGLPVPRDEFRVELTAPDGELWTFGPADAAQRVAGPALDWCLVATQRRHPDDTALVATGAEATTWLRIAQAFAGPPGAGRPPRRA